MEESLKKIELFFKGDMRIKKELYKVAPKLEQSYDIDSQMKYGESLLDSLEYIEDVMSSIADDSNRQHIVALCETTKNELLQANYQYDKLKKVYQQRFSNMDKEFIDSVKNSFAGYTLYSKHEGNVFAEAKSLNEMLHAMHSSMTNDEQLYQKMPRLSGKSNSYQYPITLYGKENEISRSIYEAIPEDLDVGYTDILGLDKRVIMMIRDRGHATTFEITEENEDLKVEYFIPKICNREMVNELRGVTKITPEQQQAKGMFFTTKEKIASDMVDIIGKIPTDADMVFNYDFLENVQDEALEMIDEELSQEFIDVDENNNLNQTDNLENNNLPVVKPSMFKRILERIKSKLVNKSKDSNKDSEEKANENEKCTFQEELKVSVQEQENIITVDNKDEITKSEITENER